MSAIPRARPLIAEMRGAVERQVPVETELRRLRDEADEYPERRKHIVALAFYLQWVMQNCTAKYAGAHGGITNYVEVVDRIERWRARAGTSVVYVTFNYDTMLEDAVSAVSGGAFLTLDRYVDDPRRILFRPHGSWNWGRLINRTATSLGMTALQYIALASAGETVRSGLIESADEWALTDEFRIIGARDRLWTTPKVARGEKREPIPMMAALSIPVDAKSDFSVPPSHLEVFREALHSVSTVLAIGWRATEDHFLSVLGGALPNPRPVWHVVSPRPQTLAAIEERLQRFQLGSSVLGYASGFSDFLEAPPLAEILGELAS